MKAGRRIFSILMVLAMLMGLAVPAVATGTKTIDRVEMEEVKMIPILHTTKMQNGIMTVEAFDVLSSEPELPPMEATVYYTDGSSSTGTLADIAAETGGTFQHVDPVHTTSAYVPGNTYNWPMKLVVGTSEYTFDCPITVLQVKSFTVDPVTMVVEKDRTTITYDDGSSKQIYNPGRMDPYVHLTFHDGSSHQVRWNYLNQNNYLWHMGYADELGATTENWGEGTHTIKASVNWWWEGNLQTLATADVTVNLSSGISMDVYETTMQIGNGLTLNVQAYPSTLNISGGSWNTSNPNVVSVSGNGTTATITATGAGNATVTYSYTDGDGLLHTAQCQVTVLGSAGGAVDYNAPLSGQMLHAGQSAQYTFTPTTPAPNTTDTWLLEFTPNDPSGINPLENLEITTDVGGGDWFVRNNKWYRVLHVDSSVTSVNVTVKNNGGNSIIGTMAVQKPTPVDGLEFISVQAGSGDVWNEAVGMYCGLQVSPTTQLAADITYTWTTSDDTVAAFEVNGTMQPSVTETVANHSWVSIKTVGAGTATVTVTATDARGGNVSKTFTVNAYAIEGALQMGSNPITVPARTRIFYSFTPDTTGGYVIYGPTGNVSFHLDAMPDNHYESSDGMTHYCESSQLDGGQAYMIELNNNTDSSQTITLTVGTMTTLLGVGLDRSEITLENVSDTFQLTASAYPQNVTLPAGGSWSSGNTDVATVDGNGVVTAVGNGNTTVTYTNSGFSASCQVTVGAIADRMDAENTYPVQVAPGETVRYEVGVHEDGKYAFYWHEEQGTLDVSMTDVPVWKEMRDRHHFWKAELDDQKTYIISFTNNGTDPVEAYVEFHKMVAPDDFRLHNDGGTLFVNESRTVNIQFEPFHTDIDGVTWSVSDSTVLSISNTTNPVTTVTAIKEGNAFLTAELPSGEKAMWEINVKPDPAAAAAWHEVVSHPGGGEYTVQVSVPSDGYYWLKWSQNLPVGHYEYRDHQAPNEHKFDYSDENFRGVVYYLTAGTHPFTAFVGDICSYTLYLDAVDLLTASDVALDKTSVTDAQIGTPVEIGLNFNANGVYAFHAESSNHNVVVPMGQNPSSILIAPVGVGTATVTVRDYNGDTVDTCTVTVSPQTDPVELQFGEQWGFGTATTGVEFIFTPDETGLYLIGFQNDDQPLVATVTDSNGAVSGISVAVDDRKGTYYTLQKGVTYTIIGTSSIPAVTDIRIDRVEEATDFNIHAQVIPGNEFETVWIPIELLDGNVADLTVTSSDSTVAVPMGYSNSFIEVKLVGGGDATITVKLGSIEKTVDVVSNGVSPDRKLTADTPKTGNLPEGENFFYFTPTVSGQYWFYRDENLPMVEGMGAVEMPMPYTINPVTGGEMHCDYHFNNGSFFGRVFTLNAGETYAYNFERQGLDEPVTIGVATVKAPTGLTLEEATYTGYVGEEISCYFTLSPDGAVADMMEPVTSDDSIVAIEAWSGHCVNICLLEEGTATMTVGTRGGLTQTFTVTVSAPEEEPGEEELPLEDLPVLAPDTKQDVAFTGSDEIGYQFIPAQTGYYRFYVSVSCTAALGVCDRYGNFQTDPILISPGEEYEYICYLEAGVTYAVVTCLEDDSVVETGKLWAEKAEDPADDQHDLTRQPAKAPTCTEDGVIEHWTCSHCSLIFSDAEGKVEIVSPLDPATGHDPKRVVGKAATCTEDGGIEYWQCDTCGGKFAEEACTTPISNVTVSKTGHVVAKVEAKAATCTEDGNIEYWTCTACGGKFADEKATTAITEVTLKAAGHKLTKVEAKAATYEADGNIEYWVCAGCNVFFGDAEGKTVVIDVVIPQLIKVEEEKATVSESAMDKLIQEALVPDTGSGEGSDSMDKDDSSKEEEVVEVVVSVKDHEDAEKTVTSAELPVASVEKLVELNGQTKEEVVLTVELGTATVTLDSKALEAVAEQVKGEEVTLVIQELEHEDLTPKQQNIIKNREVAMIISAELISGDTSVHNFQGGNVTIRLPFTPPTGTKGDDYTIIYVADDGKIEKIKTHYENGELVFTLKHFSDYVVTLDTEEASNPATGDTMQLGLMAVLAVFSAAALAGAAFAGKKRRV